MSVQLYDEAFMNKLKKWTKDTEVTILAPNETRELVSIIADRKNDTPIQLPLIALSRPGGFKMLQTGARPLGYSGLTLEASPEGAKNLRAVPISIQYQIDVYTRFQQDADEYVRNLVYNIINYPRLEVNIPYYNENYIHHSNIMMVGDIEDTSNIPERLVIGQFTRMSIPIIVDDAYLFDIKYRKSVSIDTENSNVDFNEN